MTAPSANVRLGWKTEPRCATLSDMTSFNLRLGIVWLSATAFAIQPALADLPQFDLQTAPNGSLTATMGKEIRVRCDVAHQQLVLEYFADNSVPIRADEALGFVDDPFAEPEVEAEVIEMEVALEGPGHLVGRAPADEKLLRVLGAEHMAIIAPNEMDEPWYIGRSEVLLRIARSCRR